MALKASVTIPSATNTGDPAEAPKSSRFAEKVASLVHNRPKPQVHRGDDDSARWVKILAYGNTGAGKTYAIVGFLLSGLKILVLSTDIGGNGLSSVFNRLRDLGRDDLMKNICHIEFANYDDLTGFLTNPLEIFPDIFEWDPDMVVHDGFSMFQQVHISEKVNMLTSSSKGSSEGREEGLWLEQQDWGMIRNATMRTLNHFLALHNSKNGHRWHKYMTCLEQPPRKDALTGESQRQPFVQGAAASLMGPAFDIIMEFQVSNELGAANEKNRKYVYRCVGEGKFLAKSRGYPLAPIEDADMERIWKEKILPTLRAGVKEVEV